MITFKPSISVITRYTIDFKLLSIAISSALQVVYGREISGVISVKKSRGWCHYNTYSSAIRLSFEVNESDEQALSTIIHELRHWQQDKIFNLPFDEHDYDPSTYITYYNSALERDARHFEIVEENVLQMYKALLDIKKKTEDHSLNEMFRQNDFPTQNI